MEHETSGWCELSLLYPVDLSQRFQHIKAAVTELRVGNRLRFNDSAHRFLFETSRV